MNKKILLIEDEQAIREMLKLALERECFEVTEAEDARAGFQQLQKQPADLVIVDWMMPGESGVDLIKRIRKNEVLSEIPVIMLTARVEERDKVKGLDFGADDYITKPVALRELVARINALLRRTSSHDEQGKIISGNIELNVASNLLKINNESVHIGQTEFKILHFFMTHKNKVYSRSQLLDFIWGQTTYIEERTVDVHILRLRKILKEKSMDKVIKTIRGIGYMFDETCS
ncbi:MAG: response regulator [Gammaproteobacteria bacterium]|nr:response regulator [Gammaproteobacteria bacterium]